MKWQVTTLLLCMYGFMKEFRPTEPYLYEYEHVTLNISECVLNDDVYPIWTYSYMIALIPTFLLSDLLLYKPVIIFEALSYITVWTMFVAGRSVLIQQIIEVFYGFATSTEIAYFSYIYVQVSKEQYKKVTSYSQAAVLLGRCAAYVIGQLVILFNWGTYMTLNWVSLASLIISLGLRKCEEEMERSIYFDYVKFHFSFLFKDFKTIYSDLFIVKWSIWFSLTSCAYFQILNYTQTLWGSVIDEKGLNEIYNGFVEAASPLLSIPVVLLMQRLQVNWTKWGEVALCVCSLVDGGLLFTMSQTDDLWLMYLCYIIYKIIYAGMVTIAQYNVAIRLGTDSFGFVFGLNTFIALVLQSVLTLFVIRVFRLTIRPQFVVYSGFHFVVAAIFSVPVIFYAGKLLLKQTRKISKQQTLEARISA